MLYVFPLQPCLRLDAEYPQRLSPKVPLLELVGSLGNGAYKEALQSLRMCPGRKQWHSVLFFSHRAGSLLCHVLLAVSSSYRRSESINTVRQLTLLKF